MSSSTILGTFTWHELVTGDPDAGAGFYSKVFGWNVSPWEGHPSYTMLTGEKGPVGGARVIGKDPLADALGPNWLTYVGVPDLSASLAQVSANGGRMVFPITEVPDGGGRYAVIADPHGATIGLFEPGAAMAGSGPMPSPVEWHELTSEDPEAALEFYKAIFGWEVVTTHPMGGEVGTYYLFGIEGKQMGGVYKRASHLPPSWPRWLVYLTVPGVAAAAASAQKSGGRILNGPMQVPGGNWIAQMTDTAGVAVAIHGPKDAAAKVQVAAKPKVAKAPSKPQAKPVAAKSAAPAKAKPAAVKAAPPTAAPKPKAKAKSKAKKPLAKSKPAPKSKSRPKSKTSRLSKVKVKSKMKPKAKAAPKKKSAPKTKVKAKAKKKPRRGK